MPLIGVNEIPATLSGAAAFNVENALAAAAIARGLDIEPQIIRTALCSFASSFEQNPGRFNIYDGHGFRVVMDYAHNPAGLNAFFATVRSMRSHYTNVIGFVNTPGDRRDEDILEVGRIAGRELDHIVFREGEDSRGRPQGETLQLLTEGAFSVGRKPHHITCVHPEKEATQLCLQKARPGDLVILTPTDIEGCWQQVLAFEPSFTQTSKPSSLPAEHRYHA